MEVSAAKSYTNQQRHNIIEKSVRASAEALAIPEVRSRLGKYAAELHHTLQHIEAPPITADSYLDTDNLRSNTIPITALHIGEVAFRSTNGLQLSSVQRRHIRHEYTPKAARTIIEAHDRYYKTDVVSDDLPIFEDDKIRAFVYAHQLKLPGAHGQHLYMRGRPVVALNLDSGRPDNPVSLLHELTHVMQMNRRPLDDKPFTNIVSNIQRELEAYYVSAQVIRGYHDADMGRALGAYIDMEDQFTMLEIDLIRTEYQTTPTSPTICDDLVQNLIDRDYHITAGDMALEWDEYRQRSPLA